MTAEDGSHPRDVAAAVRAAIDAVYRDTGRPRREAPATALLAADLGLDSLDLAQIVVLLERDLGVDPFRDPAAGSVRPPLRTVEHLVAMYRGAIATDATTPHHAPGS